VALKREMPSGLRYVT